CDGAGCNKPGIKLDLSLSCTFPDRVEIGYSLTDAVELHCCSTCKRTNQQASRNGQARLGGAASDAPEQAGRPGRQGRPPHGPAAPRGGAAACPGCGHCRHLSAVALLAPRAAASPTSGRLGEAAPRLTMRLPASTIGARWLRRTFV